MSIVDDMKTDQKLRNYISSSTIFESRICGFCLKIIFVAFRNAAAVKWILFFPKYENIFKLRDFQKLPFQLKINKRPLNLADEREGSREKRGMLPLEIFRNLLLVKFRRGWILYFYYTYLFTFYISMISAWSAWILFTQKHSI